MGVFAWVETYDSVLELVGETPAVEIKGLNPGSDVDVYAKLESYNPSGSVKDRPALRMVQKAELDGKLTEDKRILEATSGNTGVGLAMIGAHMGYDVEIVLPENASEEKKQELQILGAEIVESDPLEGSDGAIRKAHEMKEENPDNYFMPDQYSNPENWRAHYETTGPEILEQVPEVTHFVAGIGTGGTVTGVGRRLKEHDPDIEVIGVEPDDELHGLEGLKHMETSIKPDVLGEDLLDDVIYVNTKEAYERGRELAREEGLLVGQSSGAAMEACTRLARELESGTLVTVFPDGGERYLSTEYLEEV